MMGPSKGAERSLSLPLQGIPPQEGEESGERDRTPRLALSNIGGIIPRLFTSRGNLRNDEGEAKGRIRSVRNLIPRDHLKIDDDEIYRSLNFDYTALPYIVQKKNIGLFNNPIVQLTDSSKLSGSYPEPTSKSINALAYQLLRGEGDHFGNQKDLTSRNFDRLDFSDRADKHLSYLIQFNGFIWQQITNRLIFLKCQLNNYLNSEKKRTQWSNLLSGILKLLIELPTANYPDGKFHHSQITPLKLLIDHLSGGIGDPDIRKIVNWAAGGKNVNEVKETLRKWNERGRSTKHVWNQAEVSESPIDKIQLEQAVLSLSRGNAFRPVEFRIQDKIIDIETLLFLDLKVQREIYTQIKKGIEVTQDPVGQNIQVLIQCLSGNPFPNNLLMVDSTLSDLNIDWFNFFTKVDSEENDEEDEGLRKLQCLMKFVCIPKNELFLGSRGEKIEQRIRSSFGEGVEETKKGKEKKFEIDENLIKNEIKLQQSLICKLHDFLRTYLLKIVPESKFKEILFTHLCEQLNKEHFFGEETPRISGIIRKLFKDKREKQEGETDPDVFKFYTFLRFSSYGSYLKAKELSFALVPGLYRVPYYTKEGEMSLSLNIHPDGSFTITQLCPQFVYLRMDENPERSAVIEDSCFAKILFRWTMTHESSEDITRPIKRKAILDFPVVQFNEKATPRQIKDILDALAHYTELKETDNIKVSYSMRSPLSTKKKKRKAK